MGRVHTDLTQIPAEIQAGTTVRYTRSFSEFSADAGWTMKLYLAGKTVLQVDATANGAGFDVELTAEQTSALKASLYTWVERVKKGDEQYNAGGGTVNIVADVATATPGSLLTWEARTLEMIEAKIEGRVDKDVEEYQIGTRALKHIPMKELLQLRTQMRSAVEQQRSGRGIRSIEVTFPPVR